MPVRNDQELMGPATQKRSSISRPRNSVASSRGEGLGVETVERRPSMARSEVAASSGSSGNEDSEDDSSDDLMWQRSMMAKNNSGMDCTYWDIQKLIKYIKAGNQTATIIALCCLKDHELTGPSSQQAIRDIGGLEVLLNLLDTTDVKCKLGALQVLSRLAESASVRRGLTDLGGVPLLVNLLSSPSGQLRLLAAETLAHVARVRRASQMVRKCCDGLARLVDLLDVPARVLERRTDQLTEEEIQLVGVARAGARALWSLSQSTRNKRAIQKAGCVRLLARLLRSVHKDVLVPAAATVQQCATEGNFKLAIQTEGMIPDLVRHLSSDSEELRKHAASAIFKCAEEKATRDIVRQHGGLDPLVTLLQAEASAKESNKALVAALSGALWKCAISPENVRRFEELNTVDMLVAILQEEDNEEVLTNLVGAVAECCRTASNRAALRAAGGLPPIVALLSGTNAGLLQNVALALGQLAQEPQSLKTIEELDGVRLLWTLLKSPDPRVQANAAASLCPFIQHAKDSAEMVRSLIGGFELLVSLLASRDPTVLGSVCATVSCIASKDRDNLGIITDYGVVEMLASLVHTDDSTLRGQLSAAIAQCCSYGNNCRQFGQLGAISPLVSYMATGDLAVQRSTAHALHMLSMDPFNCQSMFVSGVVPYLLQTIGSADEKLQESSAGCLSNIRKMALAAETVMP